VRVEIMGPGKFRSVGKSQPVLIMINPIISTRTRMLSYDAEQAGGVCPHLNSRDVTDASPTVLVKELSSWWQVGVAPAAGESLARAAAAPVSGGAFSRSDAVHFD
jgi:hypothetical protein